MGTRGFPLVIGAIAVLMAVFPAAVAVQGGNAPSCPSRVPPPTVAPGAPNGPSVNEGGGGVVSWIDRSDNEDGFLVCVRSDVQDLLAFTLGRNETSFAIPDVVFGGDFIEVFVYAFNEQGLSEPDGRVVVGDRKGPTTVDASATEASPASAALPGTGSGGRERTGSRLVSALAILGVSLAAIAGGLLFKGSLVRP